MQLCEKPTTMCQIYVILFKSASFETLRHITGQLKDARVFGYIAQFMWVLMGGHSKSIAKIYLWICVLDVDSKVLKRFVEVLNKYLDVWTI